MVVMKKVLVTTALLIPILMLFVFYKGGRIIIDEVSPTPQTLGTEEVGVAENSINLDEKYYSYSVFEVKEMDKLLLIPNFTEKLTSTTVQEKYDCKLLVNAGFYTEDNNPTGLFVSNRKTLKKWINNNLLNGVFSINDFLTPRITKVQPDDPLISAVQTGPVLIENNSTQKLALSSDKPSRRVVAATTGENSLYFMVIYNKDQVFDGPYLEDLPSLVAKVSEKEGVSIADAINLDGGKASVFYSVTENLSELTFVGGYFCLTN